MANPRLNSAKILQTILESKVFFSELKKQIPEKDLPFCNMLILTTLRNWCGLNEVLHKFLQKKIPNKHRLAQYQLLAAITEILFMETAPYAVINETVANIKKSCDKFLGGMANAVLRKVVAQKPELLTEITQTSPLPTTFLPILKGYSAEDIKQIVASVRLIPPTDITVKTNPAEWQKKLNGTLLPNGSIRLQNIKKIHELPDYNAGQWWVQDAAASLPVMAMGDIRGLKVVDLCAAPGGKTAQLAARGANVTALDISEVRLNTLKQNMQRLGFENIRTFYEDALHFMQTTEDKFDAVLLDAPCSATGTFRRHPEVLHIKTAEDVQTQVQLQKQMLTLCKNILKSKGILLYSVCSICQAEGEMQIADFLQQNSDFKIVPITDKDIAVYGKWNDCLILPNGTVRTLPFYESTKNGMDSFFICKMQRII
ncbi:MAG: RsmB/NOP family class I SAM-dependent RNA methyltransferase [Alphaproteobacteria bacterium]|nr:RsmB/NOP family class I SAM-dependent RNA methyltransferase [Alphaproteobacteria bacterium]